jgi:hypothetical protein
MRGLKNTAHDDPSRVSSEYCLTHSLALAGTSGTPWGHSHVHMWEVKKHCKNLRHV